MKIAVLDDDAGTTPRRAFLALSLAPVLSGLSRRARAADPYPGRPIRVIVPFAPGGGVDIIARALGQEMSRKLGASVIVDNRAGGSTTIGTSTAARSAPDGYTLLVASTSFTTAPNLFKKLAFDPLKDFVPVAMVANAPAVLAVTSSSPATSLQKFVELAKSRPGALTSATFGSGSTPHLVSELFQELTGIRLLSVPYVGGGPAVLSTMAGETDAVFPSVLPVLQQQKAGKLRILAIASQARSDLIPDVPTFAEQGVPLVTGTWFGLVAPAGTPPGIASLLHDTVDAIQRDAGFVGKLTEQGVSPVAMSEADFGDFLRKDHDRWQAVIKTAHIQPE